MNIAIGVGVLILFLMVFRHRLFPSSVKRRSKTHRKNTKISGAVSEPMLNKQDISSQPFHCVSIHSTANSCCASEEVIGKRFLSKAAPKLPLNQCDNPHCQCRYTHHEDRREPNNNRRVDFGLTQELYGSYGEENRRLKPRGRRISDH